MAKGIVVYYSRSGNTKEMAEIIAKAMNEADVATECKSVDKVRADDLRNYDAMVVGSPTYYGHMAGPIKQLFDETVTFHGGLDGKVGGAFSSAANIGGGNETT
ncbi:MAG: flavodoxin family protein, partial [Planctomycetota bacterium]